MDQTQVDDFKKTLQDHNYPIDEFTIDEEDQTDYDPNTLSILKSRVTVTRESKNTTRTYASGHKTKWIGDFKKELLKGIFD